MSLDVPESGLTSDQLAKLANFRRELADALDGELANGGVGGAGGINPQDYGAVGDGVEDDTAAIQDAIDAAMEQGLPLVFPAGTYRTSSYLYLDGARNLTIRGNGATILYPSDDESVIADGVAFTNNSARSGIYLRYCQNVEITGLRFQGGLHNNFTQVNVGSAIYARNSSGTYVHGCIARGGYAIMAQDNQSDTNGTSDEIIVADGIVTMTDASGLFQPGHVGRSITIAGEANQQNNGSFRVTEYVSATTIRYANAQATAGTAARWTIQDRDDATRLFACQSIDQRGAVTLCNNSVIHACEFRRPPTVDCCGLGDVFTLDGTTVTLYDKAGRFRPDHDGKIITIVDATSSANEGSFRLTYVSATEVSWTNAAGVSEYFQGAWWIANGERAGFATDLDSTAGVTTLTVADACFTEDDIGKSLRTWGATNADNDGMHVISAVLSPTQIQYDDSDGVSEAFTGLWTMDSFDLAIMDSVDYGSTHFCYFFGGRNNIVVEGCSFFYGRHSGVKVHGTSDAVSNNVVRGCYYYETMNPWVMGADVNTPHDGNHFIGNMMVDCSIGRAGGNGALGVSVLGSQGVRIANNTFMYTRNNCASVDGRGVAGYKAVECTGGGSTGDVQPLENLVIEGNIFQCSPEATTTSNVVNTVITVNGSGLRAEWSANGTLAKSGSVMTLTDTSIVFGGRGFDPQAVGKYIRIYDAPDGGNNGDFLVSEWVSASQIRFVNAGGVGGDVAAGVWAINRAISGVGAPVISSWAGSTRIARNEIHVPGAVGIQTTGCATPDISDNILSNVDIRTTGDCMPVIKGNQLITSYTDTATIRIGEGTSWPIIYGNTSGSRNTGPNPGRGMTIGNAAGTVLDYPLLGTRGRAVPTEGKSEVVFAYGYGHVPGDYVVVGGSTFRYVASSPGANEFSSFAELVALIDALAGYTAVDYGDPWSIDTYHIKVAKDAVTTTPDEWYMEAYSINATALVIMYSSTSQYRAHARGEASAGPVLDKTVIWSPLASYSGSVSLLADDQAAQTLLVSDGYRHSKDADDAGYCEVLIHGDVTEPTGFRWVIHQ